MYDLFLRLVREELSSEDVIMIHPAKISEYESFIKNNIYGLLSADNESREIFMKVAENVLKDAELLVRLRIAKKVLGAKLPEDAADSEIMGIIDRLVDFAKHYMARAYVMRGNNIAARSLRNTVLEERRIRRGDIVFMDVKNSLLHYILGNVEPIKEPLIEYVIYQS